MYLKNSSANSVYDITAQELHNRAREASSELNRLLITLGTGILGVSFLWLTDDHFADAARVAQWLLASALALAGVTVLFGVMSWLADAKRCYYWAKSLQAQTADRKLMLTGLARRWTYIVRWTKWTSRAAFLLSITGLVVYIVPLIVA